MQPSKNELDRSILNYFVDLYTAIAGITRGYISVTQRDFNFSKEEAQKEILKIDAQAREKVAEAYHIYENLKEGES